MLTGRAHTAPRRLARGTCAVVVLAVAVLASAAALDVRTPEASAQAAGTASCSAGLDAITRIADGRMACVSPSTKAVLVERGWGVEQPAQDAADFAAADDAASTAAADDAASTAAADDAAAAASTAAADDATDFAAADDAASTAAASMPPPIGAAEPTTGDEMPAAAAGQAAQGTNMATTEMAVGDVSLRIAPVELTAGEAARLAGAPVRVAYDPFRLPVEFYDEETSTIGGISSLYAEAIGDALGGAEMVPIDRQAVELAGGAAEAVRAGDADVVLSIDPTDELREYMSFTSPHTSLPVVMVTAGPGPPIDAESLQGMKVGAASGYGGARWLDGQMPGQYTVYPTAAQAVGALGSGEIDVFVGLWTAASYLAMASEPPFEAYLAGETGQFEMLSIGYASSDAELGSALEKALAAVPDSMRSTAVAAATSPLGFLDDPSMAIELTGDDPMLSDLIGMADEIDAINNFDEAAFIEKMLALPEGAAFAAKHPKYEPIFYDFGMEIMLELNAADGAAMLRIDYDKDTESATFMYTCTLPDGNMQSYDGENLATDMAGLCS